MGCAELNGVPMYQSEERSAEKTDQCGTKKDSIL
jgi:hypothetical protein